MKGTKIDYLGYLNTLLWIMLSGSTLMLLRGNLFIPAAFGVFLIQALWLKKRLVPVRNVVSLFFFFFVFALNYLVYASSCWGKQQYAVNILLALSTFLYALLIYNRNFNKLFFDCMFMVALVSLVMHYGAYVFSLQSMATRQGQILQLGLHNYWAFNHGRNSGMFWEPGGFQIYLNLALVFSIYEDDLHIWLKRLVLIAAVLSTRSTAGYIILAFICIFMLIPVIGRVRNPRVRVLLWILFFVFALWVCWMTYLSETIQQKLFQSNGSTIMRQRDFVNSLKILKEIPLYGVGVNTAAKDSILMRYSITNNSVGLFASAINYGIPYMIVYTGILLRNAPGFMKKGGKAVLLTVLLLIWFTQSVFEFPIMMIFTFQLEDRYQHKTAEEDLR